MQTLKPLFDLDALKQQHNGHGGQLADWDVLSVDQFDKETISYIFARAREMREMVAVSGGVDLLKGRVLAAIFYEPSTRTSASFIAAM